MVLTWKMNIPLNCNIFSYSFRRDLLVGELQHKVTKKIPKNLLFAFAIKDKDWVFGVILALF